MNTEILFPVINATDPIAVGGDNPPLHRLTQDSFQGLVYWWIGCHGGRAIASRDALCESLAIGSKSSIRTQSRSSWNIPDLHLTTRPLLGEDHHKSLCTNSICVFQRPFHSLFSSMRSTFLIDLSFEATPWHQSDSLLGGRIQRLQYRALGLVESPSSSTIP